MKKIFKLFICLSSLFILSIISLFIFCYCLGAPDIKDNHYIRLYDNNNNLYYQSDSDQYIELEYISDDFINSIIAIEDHRFYNHHGFDIIGILRALYSNIFNNSLQGASTITQQYARLLYLSNDKTYMRKINELILAIRLELFYDKKTILEGYINNLYYGHGIYGIYNASLYYFNKEPQYLNLNESSMLAGVINGPEYYSPFKDIDSAKDRQRIVLNALVQYNYIDSNRADEVYNTKLILNDNPVVPKSYKFPYYRDTVIQELKDLGYYKEEYISKGLHIYTSLDTKIQTELEITLNNHIKDREKLENASLIVDAKSASIISLVGGRNYELSQYNRATQISRGVGSVIKPILYYIAIEQGFSPTTMFKSEPTTFVLENGKEYSPSNYNSKYAYKDITLAQAIAVSDNIYAVKTHMFLGEQVLVNFLKQFGYDHLSPHPSLALGTMNTCLYDLSKVYCSIASGGIYNDIHTIEKIIDSNGHILYEYEPLDKELLDHNSTKILSQLLTSPFYEEYSTYLDASMSSYKTNYTYACKTGTTDYDALCVGYNPEYLIMSWCGYDDNRDISVYYDTRVPKLIFRDMANYLSDEELWYDSGDLQVIPINPMSGDYDENGIIYWFK